MSEIPATRIIGFTFLFLAGCVLVTRAISWHSLASKSRIESQLGIGLITGAFLWLFWGW